MIASHTVLLEATMDDSIVCIQKRLLANSSCSDECPCVPTCFIGCGKQKESQDYFGTGSFAAEANMSSLG